MLRQTRGADHARAGRGRRAGGGRSPSPAPRQGRVQRRRPQRWPGSAQCDVGRAPSSRPLDVNMPGITGIEVCRRLKQDPLSADAGRAWSLARHSARRASKDWKPGRMTFSAKPVDPQELLIRVRSLVRIKRYTDDLDSAASIIIAMALLIEARDGNTEGHCHRMANYATALGRALDLSEDDLQALHRGGFLHDIGMLAIPDSRAAEDRAARPRRVRADEVAHDRGRLALRQPALARLGAADHPPPPRALRRLRLSRRPGR